MGFLAAFVICYSVIRLSKPVAFRLGLVDTPNERKVHDGAIPLVGGIGIFVGVFFASILFISSSAALNIYLLASVTLLFIGVLDDRYDLKVSHRLFAQTLAGALIIFGAGLYLDELGNLFGLGSISLGQVGTIVTVIAIIAGINAFNMVDGIDGLAGMLSIVTFTAIATLMFVGGNQWFMLPLLFIAAILAYLMFNLEWPMRKYRKIFMGDAGSMVIGFTVVFLLIVGTQGNDSAFRPVTALWIIALPLMDMAAIMIRRVLKGDSPFKPDRDHLHHIFMRLGLSPIQALWAISFFALLLAAIGVVSEWLQAPEWLMLVLFVVLFGMYTLAIKNAWKLLTMIRKTFGISS